MQYINTELGDIAVHTNDLIASKLVNEKTWEPYNVTLMQQYIKPNDEVLDIGANIGFFSIVLSNIVKENGTVHAFEPVAENFKLLSMNVNSLDNVKTYNLALGNISGNVSMASEQGNWGNSYITDEHSGDIKICKLDSLNLNPSFIKMDVQGFEYDVLLGAKETINRCRPYMIIELEDSNGSIPTSFKQSKQNSIDLLTTELNYTIYNIDSDYPVDYLCIPN